MREAPHACDQLAQWLRDRAREKARDDEREARGDDSGDDERWEERAQGVGERGPWARDDDDRGRDSRRVRADDLLHEEPLIPAVVERAEVALRCSIEHLLRQHVVAVDEHATRAADDEEARVGRLRLFDERVDDALRILVVAQRRRHRHQERRAKLLESYAGDLVLVPNEEARDGDRRRDEPDEHDGEVGEEEAAAYGADHQPGGTSLYPTPQTVSIFASAPTSLSRSCFTCTSTVRVSPGYAKPQTSSKSLSRVRTMPG